MNSRLVLKSEMYSKSFWKNGLGTTNEIDLHEDPTGKTPYLFRLSEAQLTADHPFSEFVGYQRLLTITEGDGVYLNQRPLLPLTVFSFSGEDKISCHLINGPCKDLGFIFDPKKISATMDIFNQVATFPQIKLNLTADLNYLFLISGRLQIGDLFLDPRDTLKISGPQELIFSSLAESAYILIKITYGPGYR